jgi:hypothetical protein
MRSTTAKSIIALLAAGAVSVATAAAGGHTKYRWQDGSGSMHYADVLPDEALQFGYDVLDAKGNVVRHVNRARSGPELEAEEAATAAATAAKRAAEQQAVSDQRMVAAYPSEKEFVAARQARIDSFAQTIRAATDSLGYQEQSLSDNLAHAAELDRTGKPVPDQLKRQIESLRKSAEALRAFILRREREKADAEKTFQTDLVNYREARNRVNSGVQ